MFPAETAGTVQSLFQSANITVESILNSRRRFCLSLLLALCIYISGRGYRNVSEEGELFVGIVAVRERGGGWGTGPSVLSWRLLLLL